MDLAAKDRIVVDADPEVKRKLQNISYLTGKSMRQLIEEYIEKDWEEKKNQILGLEEMK